MKGMSICLNLKIPDWKLIISWRFYLFKNVWIYTFVNCKQSKNKYVFSFSFSLLYTLFTCPTFSNLYNNDYNNNCLFDILLTQLFAILLTTEIFKHVTSHKADWIRTDCCPFCLDFLYTHAFCLQNVLNIKGSLSRLLAFSRIVYVHSHTCLSLFQSYIHTIHNWSLQPFSQVRIIDLVFHTYLLCCVC